MRSIAVALAVFATEFAHAQRPCARPPAKKFTDGETVVLSETKIFPCTLEFRNTPIALKIDGNDAVVDMGGLARGPDGRLYTSARQSAEISVWSADGKFVKNIGKEGRGPGEFGRGVKDVRFGKNGELYVATNGQLTLLSPALEFVRTIPPGAMGASSDYSAFLSDGRVLSAAPGRGGRGNYFYIVNPADSATPEGPPVARVFGAFGADGREAPRGSPYRRISYGGGTTFVAGAPDGAGWGYVVDLYSLDGKHLRTFKRDVPWFPTGMPTSRGGTPPPEMEQVFEDGTGLLYVATMVINGSADEALFRDPNRREEAEKAIEIRVEVIDMNAGAVLASLGPMRPSVAMKTIPGKLFPRSRQGWRRDEDADGLPIMRIVEYNLVAKR